MEDLNICGYCGTELDNLSELNIHKANEHAADEAVKGRFPCKRCGSVTGSSEAYAQHIREEHPEVIQRVNLIWWSIVIASILFVLWRSLT